ncbi:MAG: AAA family ATPase [Anaerolineae bacterium]|nr:AAA family ATPase [Anaerolineae bacterium]
MLTNALFRFYLFGPFRLTIDERAVSLPPQPAAFCAFMILNRQRRITREEVQAVFWPDAAPARAQERLRRTLYLLRKALRPHDDDLIAAEGNELAIAPDAALWVDYEAFEKALMDAYSHEPPDCAGLQDVVALYHDDLLKDVYADWALLEREHAHQQFLTALRHLIAVNQQNGDWSSVIRYAHRLLEHDPLQEAAHRALMSAYCATGDRSAAVRQYQQCAQILRDELEAEPLEETTRLYEDIRQGRCVKPVKSPAPVTAPAPAVTELHQMPLVGRDHELAEIAAEWQICQQNHSRLMLITGPAGMGKTRLVEEAVSRVPGPAVTVITGNCYAMEAGTPYQLISDLMYKAVDRVADRLDPVARADLAQLVPALQPDPPGVAIHRPGRTPDASVRLQEAVAQVIRLLASSGFGLWLVTEDLHWADPASLACLNHALRRCHDLPLMVLATLRDEEVSFDSPLMDWPTSSVHAPAPTTHIHLPPLPLAQLTRLLSQVIEQDTGQLAPLLFRETAGNPFFVVETLRALVEQGILYADQHGGWQLRPGALPEQPADLPLSDTVLRMIQGRVRRLSRAAQEVLTIAAVIEHNIDEKLLAALADPSLSLDLALDEVLRALILEETTPGLYQFTHIKVREIIYADASAPRRRFLHRRIAEMLAQRDEDTLPHISQLAYHYAQAREWTPALIHAWRAALTAQTAGAMAEANRYAEVAQGILDEHAAELDVDQLSESLAAIRFDLLALRAEFRRQTATAGLYYPPDMMAALEHLLPDVDDSRQARASLQRAIHLLGQGDLTDARMAAERGRALYVRLHDRWGELNAVQTQIDIAYRGGDMVTMRRLLDDMRSLSASTDHAEFRQALAYNETRLAIYEGNWIKVLALAQELSSLPQTHLDISVAWRSLAALGLAYMKLGAIEQAYDFARQAVEVSEDANVLGLGARVLLARLELWRGNPDRARLILHNLLDTPDPLIGEVDVVSPALALVRCCVAEDDTTGAKQWAKRAALAVSRVRLPILYPLSEVAWALAHLALHKYDEVQNCLRYPLEYILLLEDTSPQEIFALRAAAARGLGEHAAADTWLGAAWDTIQQQANNITGTDYHDSFLRRVPLHRAVISLRATTGWQPGDLLKKQHQPD